jgi:hypothetical protein
LERKRLGTIEDSPFTEREWRRTGLPLECAGEADNLFGPCGSEPALATERVERRLAAILAADVVGFVRLMRVDEEGALARLKAHRRELIDRRSPSITAASSRRRVTACSSSSAAWWMFCTLGARAQVDIAKRNLRSSVSAARW